MGKRRLSLNRKLFLRGTYKFTSSIPQTWYSISSAEFRFFASSIIFLLKSGSNTCNALCPLRPVHRLIGIFPLHEVMHKQENCALCNERAVFFTYNYILQIQS